MIHNQLIFKNSPIYPDNSHIRWGIDGRGFFGDKLTFQLVSNNRGDSCFIFVKGVDTSDDYIKMSKIFWNSIEWSKTPNSQDFYHAARKAAMQWAEDFLMNAVTKELTVS